MPEPILKTSCCGCTLELGTKIIAWLNLTEGICYSIFFALYIILIIQFEVISSDNKHISPDINDVSFEVLLIAGSVLGFCFFLIVVFFIGVFAKRPVFFLPWLLMSIVIIVSTVIYAAYELFQIGFSFHFILLLIHFVMRIYFFLVVYSYYQQIKT